MAALQLSDDLIRSLEQEAATRGLSPEDYLRSMLRHQQTRAARRKIEHEQEWWLNQPLSLRARYEGQYVAIHNQTLIDHDIDERELSQRVRATYGNAPIPIIPAEGPREIRIYSARLIEED